MSKSMTYLTVLLKDNISSLKKLVRLQYLEHKLMLTGQTEDLPVLIKKIKILKIEIELQNREKTYLLMQLNQIIKNPKNRIEKIQAAECKILMREIIGLLGELDNMDAVPAQQPRYLRISRNIRLANF